MSLTKVEFHINSLNLVGLNAVLLDYVIYGNAVGPGGFLTLIVITGLLAAVAITLVGGLLKFHLYLSTLNALWNGCQDVIGVTCDFFELSDGDGAFGHL